MSFAPAVAVALHPAGAALPPALFDEGGFLADTGAWTPALAEQLAAEAGIEALTAKHWEVIRLVRERWFTLGALPVMRLVCRAAGVERSAAHRLFSSCRSLWRIAGLPDPGEETKAYMN